MSKHLVILPDAVRRLLDGAERERAYAARERIVPRSRAPAPRCPAPAARTGTVADPIRRFGRRATPGRTTQGTRW